MPTRIALLKPVRIALLFAATAAAQNISYTYDASGRIALADYGNGTQIQYTYDNAGNLLTRTVVTPDVSSTAAKPAAAAKKNPRQEKRSDPRPPAADRRSKP